MEKNDRNRIKKILKESHQHLIEELADDVKVSLRIEKRVNNLRRKISGLLRKQLDSNRSVRQLRIISANLFGLIEDLRMKKYFGYKFQKEILIINQYFTNYLESRISTNYENLVNSFGESLLCGYIDCLINVTKSNTPKSINISPSFLINPNTNQLMEIDLALDEYEVFFEFQGHQSHYENYDTMLKDRHKLYSCFNNNKILIPINIAQLNSRMLTNLIINTIKDYLGLKDLILGDLTKIDKYNHISNKKLSKFSKLIQRIYLANLIFGDTLSYLDNRSSAYILKMKMKDPIGFSQNYDAPRFINHNEDYNIEKIYFGLVYVTKLRRKRNKTD